MIWKGARRYSEAELGLTGQRGEKQSTAQQAEGNQALAINVMVQSISVITQNQKRAGIR